MVKVKKRNFDIVGIGNAIVDVIAEVDDSYLEKNKINKGAMSLVEYSIVSKIGSEVKVVNTISGGSVAN